MPAGAREATLEALARAFEGAGADGRARALERASARANGSVDRLIENLRAAGTFATTTTRVTEESEHAGGRTTTRCPRCGRETASGRFAHHLERCLRTEATEAGEA